MESSIISVVIAAANEPMDDTRTGLPPFCATADPSVGRCRLPPLALLILSLRNHTEGGAALQMLCDTA